MTKIKSNKTKKTPRDKYALGSFVEGNKQVAAQYQGQIDSLVKPQGGGAGSGAMTGIGTGASIGTSILPGWGTAIGAVVGGIGGLLFGSSRDRKEREAYRDQINQLNTARSNLTRDLYESSLDTNNENPYGVYADGGEVKDPPKKTTLSKQEASKRRQDIYNPIRDKLNRVVLSNTENIDPEIIDILSIYDESDGINTKTIYGTPLNNPPAMSNDLKGLQGLINKMPDKKLRNLFETNWSGLSTIEAVKKAVNAGVGYGDIIKYGRYLKRLKDSGNTFADGGDVFPVNPLINIEKGELQIDPNTGKILREYKGINPETGGMYESHNNKGKDSKNNMVTAEEGTFIITKKEAKKYKDAVENNDKLYQNSIMSNIRNQKNKISNRYATGGIVDPNILPQLPLAGVNPNMNINIPNILNRPVNTNLTSNIAAPTNNALEFGNIASTALNYLPSIYNMVQGSRRANTMPYTPIRMNIGARQQILSNLPRELSVNPALNNISRARNRAYRSITNNTSNPAIARSNRLSLEDSFINAENEALYNNQLVNNQIRSQRAGILSNLSAQDQARDAQNVQLMNNTLLQNRQMQLAKQQQFDYGLTQLQQMYQNNRTNRQRRNMEQRQLDILNQIFPALSYYPSLTNQIGGV